MYVHAYCMKVHSVCVLYMCLCVYVFVCLTMCVFVSTYNYVTFTFGAASHIMKSFCRFSTLKQNAKICKNHAPLVAQLIHTLFVTVSAKTLHVSIFYTVLQK